MKELELRLVYLLAVCFDAHLAMPLRGDDLIAGQKGRAIESEDAYAMIKYWPDHAVFEYERDEPSEPDALRKFQVARVDVNVSVNPEITFLTRVSWEEAQRQVGVLEEHYREWMKPEDLEGKDLFFRMSAILRHRHSWEAAMRERDDENKKAAEQKQKREAKKAALKTPGSDFHRAELSIRHGEEFHTTVDRGWRFTRATTTKSSREAALKLLRNPESKIVYLEETPRHNPLKEGYVKAELGLSNDNRRPGEATTRIIYWAPPAATLVEQAALKAGTPQALAPRKPLRERSDVL
jgi:hypothetical protein